MTLNPSEANALASCRAGCAACCITPSISSPIPQMPQGKPAGVRCAQLNAEGFCQIFQQASRPKVCGSLQPSLEMCGAQQDVQKTREHAMRYLGELERLTQVTHN